MQAHMYMYIYASCSGAGGCAAIAWQARGADRTARCPRRLDRCEEENKFVFM